MSKIQEALDRRNNKKLEVDIKLHNAKYPNAYNYLSKCYNTILTLEGQKKILEQIENEGGKSWIIDRTTNDIIISEVESCLNNELSIPLDNIEGFKGYRLRLVNIKEKANNIVEYIIDTLTLDAISTRIKTTVIKLELEQVNTSWKFW